jgi:hypothetical protein
MAARVGERRFRASTKEDELSRAKDVAEEWYLGLRGALRAGVIEPKKEQTFGDAAKRYLDDLRVLAIGTRSPKYVSTMELRMNRHILPFFATKPLSAVNRSLVQSYRVKRADQPSRIPRRRHRER